MGVDHRVDAVMFNRLLKGAKVSLAGSACGSVLVAVSQLGSEKFNLFLMWLGLVFFVIAIRYLITRYAASQRQLHGYRAACSYRYCLTLSLSGASWGVLTLLAPGVSAMTKVLMVTAIQSMVMGSVLTMAPSMVAFFSFTVPAIFPLIFLFGCAPEIESKVIAVYSAIFFVLMVWITHGINQSLRNTERMRFEKEDLIQSLKKANEKISIQNEELNHFAHHDQLTGLPNRKMLSMHLHKALEVVQIQQSGLAVLFLDLDGFKAVNDSLGHEAGDTALIEVCRRLATVLNGTDLLARVGGDEFVIVIAGLGEDAPAILEQYALRCLDVFSLPFEIKGKLHQLATSIGMVISAGENNPEQLLSLADNAMYQAKQRGAGAIELGKFVCYKIA